MTRSFSSLNPLFAALALALFSVGGAGAQGVGAQDQFRSEQDQARKEMRAGNIMRSGEIEAKILPMMPDAEYLGFAYDPAARAYRLKFIREGRVTHVDVDARTGRIINRSR
jgi:hypothetical protein